MRYEKGRKETTHDRILEVATRRFRQDGIAASGLAGIMSEAGLTNGAFYAHFSSKSEMVEKCIERAIDDQWQQFEKEIAAGRLVEIIRSYLSEQHRDHADSGCPSAALLPEISRQEPATRHVYTESVKRLVSAMEKQLPDMPKGPKAREIAIATMGLLIGTLQMARAVNDPSLSDDILAAGTHVAKSLIQSGKRRV
ncbi:TetR/AcrR family transcriptional regulator [Silvibacterium dinghuense]|uniref:TetR/AcrR family transcriptional regulator n=1 Tax=Silvibacterium dinghuense TaxID=1560006 RepID=A0A4Q1SB39_9BACT|nr:TetR/AcrR family transcriptional regulator [Silvibacterium dinghuense]RXS94348.1 TetR/AcrR family transcriptional regulator [Silvibacterium dinghuense]GGH16732.1 TetR family transcriptional regulator [Silvibacterium dinghuense]